MYLETTWFVIWGVLWAIYFILDGFDLGMGTLMPALAKTDTERRMVLNSAGPFWDGNEVWLITAGGVTFAAFPLTYAVMFSGLYSALLLLLFALIFRGVSFEFRSKLEDPGWRKIWDGIHSLCSFLPALLLGVAFANIFMGIPINADGINEGGLFDLLNIYGLMGGVLFVVMFAYHGAIWLGIKTEGVMHERAVKAAKVAWPFFLGLTVLFLGLTYEFTNLFANYMEYPWLLVILVLAVVGFFLSRASLGAGNLWTAWAFNAVTIGCITMFGVLGMYPRLLPLSLNDEFSMTIMNSASTPLTLKIMLGVALVFVPIVIIYQSWAYKTFSYKVTEEELKSDEAY